MSFVGGSWFNSGEEPFNFGNCLLFDGVNDYVSNGYTFSSVSSAVISFWFYADSSMNIGTIYNILAAFNNLNFSIYYLGGNIRMRQTPNEYTLINYSGASPYDAWHHVVIVQNSVGSIDVYADGVFVANYPYSILDCTVAIGSKLRNQYGNTWLGKIDELAIKNSTTITAGQVSELYNDGNGANFIDVVGGADFYYQFNETTGTTAADSSGNGNNGTLNNFTGTFWVAH